MSDTEQAVLVDLIAETTGAAPLVRAREAFLEAQAEDEALGQARQALKAEGQALAAQLRQVQDTERWSPHQPNRSNGLPREAAEGDDDAKDDNHPNQNQII